LVCLQREFSGRRSDNRHATALTVGAAAGALLVAESLVSATANAGGEPSPGVDPAGGPNVFSRLLGCRNGGRAVPSTPGQSTQPSSRPDEGALHEVVRKLKQAATGGLTLTNSELQEALRLIADGRLEPRERVAIYKRDSDRLDELGKRLVVPHAPGSTGFGDPPGDSYGS
jgi:hypothetical protein